MLCKQQVAQLRGYVERIRAQGAELVVIGNGNAAQARAFRDAEQVTFPLYTDPSLTSYRAAGLKRSLGSVLSPKVWLHGLSATVAGHRQSATQGDALQQGGVFVFDVGGVELYRYVSQEAGDHPDPDAILAALKTRVRTSS